MTSVDLLAALIHAAIDAVAFLVEPPVNLITLSIETIGKSVPAGCIRTVRFAVEAPIDTITFSVQTVINAIALSIETIFNSVAAIVESLLDLVAGIRPDRTTYNQQDDCDRYCFPDIHVKSPLYPYQVMSSVGTTRLTQGR